jgi:hypothetical protein
MSEPDEAVAALATRVFGLARSGDTATLVMPAAQPDLLVLFGDQDRQFLSPTGRAGSPRRAAG